ncbi:MAG: radical SAM family heme chaperone HemW [Propionibacteriaceae bacterium]|nr:radical SAM family heme chaperone HemW [Propionibacteriaceae bacterium]
MVSLYIHVPFCAVRCGYCDFNTYLPEHAGIDFKEYLAGLDRELTLAERTFGSGAELQTVFFGGGTPTLLGDSLAASLELVRRRFTIPSDAEVSTEANPETLTPKLLDTLLVAGFNRLSIGMQSSCERVLTVLDRAHTPGRVVAAVGQAKVAGFTNINLDLIYGTPGETMFEWRCSLQHALATEPTHLSAYALTLESNTPLARRIARGELAAITADDLADKYLVTEAEVSQAGFCNYEISNWSLPGRECRHNMAYWLGADWWGIGPGAHSHIGMRRWWNVNSPRRWMTALAAGKSPCAGEETLDDAAQKTERVMLRLRLATGLPLEWLPASVGNQLNGYVTAGLALIVNNSLVLTAPGRLLADRIALELLD